MTNLPPVPPRKNFDDVDPDSLVFALFLNPLFDTDPIDTDRPEYADQPMTPLERVKARREERRKAREQ
jgi:hypothetical protein